MKKGNKSTAGLEEEKRHADKQNRVFEFKDLSTSKESLYPKNTKIPTNYSNQSFKKPLNHRKRRNFGLSELGTGHSEKNIYSHTLALV